jgi:hypothetical protein
MKRQTSDCIDNNHSVASPILFMVCVALLSTLLPAVSRAQLATTLHVPTPLVLNAAGDALTPNPFSVFGILRNNDSVTHALEQISIDYPAGGVRLHHASPAAIKETVSLILHPGDSAMFEWRFAVASRNTVRQFPVAMRGTDDHGNTFGAADTIPIPAVAGGYLECLHKIEQPEADWIMQRYTPNPFYFTLDATSRRAAATDSLFARIILPPGDLTLSDADPGLAEKPVWPAVLLPGQECRVWWNLIHHTLAREDRSYRIRTLLWERGGDTTIHESDITFSAIPAPFRFKLRVEGPPHACSGVTVRLRADYTYATYLWNNFLPNERVVDIFAGNTVWCIVTDYDGMPGYSDTVHIAALPRHPVPVIRREGNTLITDTDSATTWQWYRYFFPVPGATERSFTPEEYGWYRVVITNEHGCEQLSEPFPYYHLLSVQDPELPTPVVHLYPNPARDFLHLDAAFGRASPVTISLHDMLGRELRRVRIDERQSRINEQIDLHGLRPGMYMLRLQADGMMESRTVMVR